MAIMSPIIKKIHDKLDELRDVNALLQLAKTEHEQITADNEKRLREVEKREEAARLLQEEVELKRQELEASVDRTHLKLADSVSDLNERSMALGTEIKSKEIKLEGLNEGIAQKEKTLASVEIDLAARVDELKEKNLEIERINIAIADLEVIKERNHLMISKQEKRLVAMGEDEKNWQQRKADMELYGKRIKKLYKEQGIDLDI
jgi:chromosome segregation ATPase